MDSTVLSWAGLDDPSRIDQATVAFAGESMQAIGTSQSASFVTSWALDVGAGWQTRTLSVTSRGFGWSRSLELCRAATGVWSSRTGQAGEVDLPAPGLADPDSVRGAVDCDLGLCPVTNTMPIRRLRLLDRDVQATPLTMAWVEVPSLRVVRSDQVYSSLASDDGRRVRYSSAEGAFRAELVVDADGLVLEYPGLARRVQMGGTMSGMTLLAASEDP